MMRDIWAGQDADSALDFANAGGCGGVHERIEGKVLGFGKFDGAELFGGDAAAPGFDVQQEDLLGHLLEGIGGTGGPGEAGGTGGASTLFRRRLHAMPEMP